MHLLLLLPSHQQGNRTAERPCLQLTRRKIHIIPRTLLQCSSPAPLRVSLRFAWWLGGCQYKAWGGGSSTRGGWCDWCMLNLFSTTATQFPFFLQAIKVSSHPHTTTSFLSCTFLTYRYSCHLGPCYPCRTPLPLPLCAAEPPLALNLSHTLSFMFQPCPTALPPPNLTHHY